MKDSVLEKYTRRAAGGGGGERGFAVREFRERGEPGGFTASLGSRDRTDHSAASTGSDTGVVPRNDSGADSVNATEAGGTEDCGAFGWLRGVRDRAPMLELRKRDGNILAVAYSWIERVEFDPSVGITLHVAGRSIIIKGRNLNEAAPTGPRLFEGITRHRVAWVQETLETTAICPAHNTMLIEAILG